MDSQFAQRLSQAERKCRESTSRAEDTFHRDVQAAAERQAEYRALRDFQAYWLPRINEAYLDGQDVVDNRAVKDRYTDPLYGWALHTLLVQELGARFEVTEVRPLWRKSYVRVKWWE